MWSLLLVSFRDTKNLVPRKDYILKEKKIISFKTKGDKKRVGSQLFLLWFSQAPWHQGIFPKSPPFSIFTPKMFNNQVRDGLVWFQFSKDTRVGSLLEYP